MSQSKQPKPLTDAKKFPENEGWLTATLNLNPGKSMSEAEAKEFCRSMFIGKDQPEPEWGVVYTGPKRVKVIFRRRAGDNVDAMMQEAEARA